MTCTLDKYTIYQLNSVKYDLSQDKYIVSINNAPKSCAEAQFVGSATMAIDAKLNSALLSYDTAAMKAQVMVPNIGMVQMINAPIHHYLLWFSSALAIGALFSWGVKKLLDSIEKKEAEAIAKARSSCYPKTYAVQAILQEEEFNRQEAQRHHLPHYWDNNSLDYNQKLTASGQHAAKISPIAAAAAGALAGAGAVTLVDYLSREKENKNVAPSFDTTAMTKVDAWTPSESSSFSSVDSSYSSASSSFSGSDSSFSSDSSSYSSDSTSFSGD